MSLDVTTLALAKSYTDQHSGGGWPSDLPKPSVGGYGYTEQGNQTVITWDGNTEGKLMVNVGVELYKISELTPTTEEVIGGVIYTKTNDGIFTTEITADSITTMSEHLYKINGYGQNMVVVALEYSEINGVTFERGVYFNKSVSGTLSKYIKSITYGTPDTVHKIDEKYMPEGYPTKSVQTTTLIEEQEFSFVLVENKGLYVRMLTTAPEIVEGQTYTVNWDGTEYECVCFVYNSILAFGNLSIAGIGDDTGEPFFYDSAGNAFVTLDTSASHTISVKRTEEIVTPIAEEFLPAGVRTTALITYDLDTNTYSSDLSYDELYARLLDGKQIVFYTTDGNEYLYLTKWTKTTSGRIDLAFAGDVYSVSLKTDGTIGKKLLE